MARKMSKLEVHQVKVLICEGHSQIDAARVVGISAAHVSRICMGDVHRDVPWPNADVGRELMRQRRERTGIDTAQAQLATGIAQPPLPNYDVKDAIQLNQDTESQAIKDARRKAEILAEAAPLIRKIEEEQLEKENKEFLEAMTGIEGEPDQNDPAIMPTPWEAQYIEWDRVIEMAGALPLVQVADREEDTTIQRAIGIIFHTLPQESWDTDQALRMVSSVLDQLKVSHEDEMNP